MISQIDHINIVVSDLKKAQAFFELLDFAVQDGATLNGEWISSVVGLRNVNAEFVALKHPNTQVTVELISYNSPAAETPTLINTPNAIGFRHLAFRVDNIESVVAKLKPHNIKFLSDIQIFPKNGKKLVYFHGPDDILFELAEYQKGEIRLSNI